MKKGLEMKKVTTIVQWILAVVIAICALGTGFHWSSVLLLVSAAIMMPIPKIRNLLNRFKLKNWLIIILSILIFFVGVLCSPASEVSSDSNESAYSDSLNNDESTSTNNTTQSSNIPSNQNSSSNGGSNNTPPAESGSSNSGNNQHTVGNGTATPVNPSALAAYSSSPYVIVNNNIPSFSQSELTTVGYESYSNLDSLGRCGVALASCGKEIMPADGEERGSISSIYPTGWVQAQYDNVSGGYLWNRSHLIGWQLSAENANQKNLITGTRYMNTEGMLPFENMVADYIKETSNHVAYRVTPIFEGNNLVCSGVQIEAYSIEDHGDGIQFNVYCYNVQPGITIDYTTGNSLINTTPNDSPNGSPPAPDDNNFSNSGNTNTSTMVWIPSSGTKYHSKSTCSNMTNPTQVTQAKAEQQGYEPCKKCY